MKKLLLGLVAAAVMSLSVGHAATTASTQATGTAFQLVSSSAVVDYITVLPDGTNTTFYLYDLASTTLTNLQGGYTNYYLTNATVVTSFTNYSGIVESYTNSALIYATNEVASSAGTYSPFSTVIALADVPTTFTISKVVSKGLVISNSHAATVIAGYREQ